MPPFPAPAHKPTNPCGVAGRRQRWPLQVLRTLAAAALAGVSPALWAQAQAEPRFDIFAFAVHGNTQLSVAEVEAAVYPFLGESRRLGDAEGARAALEALYQKRGFLSVVVTLPPQPVDRAEIRLDVTEARVERLAVTGAAYHLPSRIAEQVPSLAPGSVPNFEQVQAELGRASGRPDLQITPVITPGRDASGLNIELQVQDRLPLHGHVELNSRQSYNTERGRLDAQLRYDNLFQRGHSVSLTAIVAPTAVQQSRTAVLGYSLPVAATADRTNDPARLSLSLVSSDSQTPTSLGGNTVVNGESLGLGWRQPLRSPRAGFSRAWSAGFDYKHNRDRSELGGGAGSNSGNSDGSLRYWALRLGWDAFDSDASGVQTLLDVQLGLGLAGLNRRAVDCPGRGRTEQFACKRSGALPAWQLLRLNATHRRPLGADWTLQLRAQAQLAGDALSSGEQFGAGGLDSVRGYHEYEQIGDQGVVLGTQISSPLWAAGGPWRVGALAFVEGAALRVNQALPGEQSRIRLLGLGAGLRGSTAGGLSVALDLAWPLQRTLKADSNGDLQTASGRATDNATRIDLSLRQAF